MPANETTASELSASETGVNKTVATAKPQVFIDIDLSDLSSKVAAYHEREWRFVNICGSTVDGGVELIYSFADGLPLENLRLVVPNDATIESISALYPNAFFFENETHDLFGIKYSGISIDFDGQFYKVSVPTPMNPNSQAAMSASSTASKIEASSAISEQEASAKGDN